MDVSRIIALLHNDSDRDVCYLVSHVSTDTVSTSLLTGCVKHGCVFSTQLSDEVICLERGGDCLHMVQLMPLHPKTPTPSSLASFKSRLVLPFWYQLTQVFLGKRPFSSSSSSNNNNNSSSSSRNNVDSTFYCNVTEKMFCVPCLCHSLLRQRCIQLFR